MKPIRTLLALAVIIGCFTTNAWACDPKTPRCQKLNELLDLMGYKDRIATVQMECRGRAARFNPENLAKRRPAMLMGIEKDTPSWTRLYKAFDDFVEEACGSEEVLYLLLAGYRYAWDTRLPGKDLDGAVAAIKAKGPAVATEDAVFVSKRVNDVMLPLLERMANVAEYNYQARIKGILTGEALEIADGDMCEPPNEMLTPLPERILPPTRLRPKK